jgi:uncharacterized protein YjbI with pentapeptide repeats
MREITADELSKILKEHKRWRDTDEKEGEKADLSDANLKKANLKKANLNGADLSDANLSDANLSDANLFIADLRGANLRRAKLIDADLRYASLSHANLSNADLSDAKLSDASLSHADLRKADLSGAGLRKADLSGADLSGADLSDADLSDADLWGTDLSGADLSDADLSDAVLIGTVLSGADLIGAVLSGANLSNANLIRVRGLTLEQLSSVETLCDAELSSERIKQVRKKYPHLLGEIEIDEEELRKPKITTLRSSYKTLSIPEVQSMPNVSIHEKHEDGFFGYSTINHDYNLKIIEGDTVVVDNATGLMWHQSGTDNRLVRFEAKEWVKKLNKGGYAGYHDWRLPTLEEAVSLLESSNKNGDYLYIDPVFSKKQVWIWTGDRYGSENAGDRYGSEYAFEVRFWEVRFLAGDVGRGDLLNLLNGYHVRPVRSVR